MNAESVAASANVVSRWCGVRDASTLTREALRGEVGLSDGVADLFVLFGGGVVGSVDVLASALQADVARRYAIVGGRGHATYWLDEAFERELCGSGAEGATLPQPGASSEAEMLAALLWHRHGLQADLLETNSTNCGNNIAYLMDLLEAESYIPASVILCQDCVMQRRMDATWRRQARDRAAFAQTRVVNWSSYQAVLGVQEGRLSWVTAPEGVWPLDAYLGLLLGEVVRLTDDERGYGPRGSDFVVHVDVPTEVIEAASVLRATLGAETRPADERYA